MGDKFDFVECSCGTGTCWARKRWATRKIQRGKGIWESGIEAAIVTATQLWDWDMLGKEKVGEGQTPPVKELSPGESKDVWVELELEAETVRHIMSFLFSRVSF